MTSNQLAMNANAESMRHNIATEQENREHNRNIESIQEKQNAIEEQKNQWLDERERAKLEWQKEYDSKYLELQRSQGDRKLELEAELNQIKALDEQHQNEYRQGMLEYNNRLAELQDARDQEVARHNLQLETIEGRNASSNEYRNTLIKEQNEIAQFGAYSNYVLGLRDVGLKSRDVYTREKAEQRQNAYQEEMLGLQKSKTKSETVRNYLDGAASLVNAGSHVVSTVSALTGGSKDGTKKAATKLTKQVAESILFSD